MGTCHLSFETRRRFHRLCELEGVAHACVEICRWLYGKGHGHTEAEDILCELLSE